MFVIFAQFFGYRISIFPLRILNSESEEPLTTLRDKIHKAGLEISSDGSLVYLPFADFGYAMPVEFLNKVNFDSGGRISRFVVNARLPNLTPYPYGTVHRRYGFPLPNGLKIRVRYAYSRPSGWSSSSAVRRIISREHIRPPENKGNGLVSYLIKYTSDEVFVPIADSKSHIFIECSMPKNTELVPSICGLNDYSNIKYSIYLRFLKKYLPEWEEIHQLSTFRLTEWQKNFRVRKHAVKNMNSSTWGDK